MKKLVTRRGKVLLPLLPPFPGRRAVGVGAALILAFGSDEGVIRMLTCPEQNVSPAHPMFNR